MANSRVQINPDSTGKSVQTFENEIDGNIVQSQGVVPVDTLGAYLEQFKVSIEAMAVNLQRLLQQGARPIWLEPGTARLKVTLENTPAFTVSSGTVTTVSTVTTMNQLAGFSAKDTLLNTVDRTCYYQGTRQRIT